MKIKSDAMEEKLIDTGPSGKQCFIYCGDSVCNCEKSPKYRNKTFESSIATEQVTKKFQKTNAQNMSYYSKLMNGVETFLKEISTIATEKDIYFEYPCEILLTEEWMASGVVLNWMPICGDENGYYSAELVLIWNGEAENPASCIRAVIHKNRKNDGYERVFVKQSEHEFLNAEQAFEIFIKLKELEGEICQNFTEDDFSSE